MEHSGIGEFQRERERLMGLLLEHAGRDMKRFLTVDHQAYQAGALDTQTKELLGLVASTVLRCDDCIRFHLINCHAQGFTTEELIDALTIAMVAGGSVTIPHIRRAVASWQELREGTGSSN